MTLAAEAEGRLRFAPRLTSPVIALIAFFTLVDLFAAQAILPLLAKHYGARPAQIGVAVNASTAGMSAGALLTALFGGRLDRRAGVVGSLLLLTAPSFLLAFAPDLGTFAALRVAQGLCMSCAFTLTLSHLGEACTLDRQAGAFAAYITGNVASNLVGRLVSALTAGAYGTSAVFILFAVLNLLGAGLAAASIRPRTHAASEGPSPRLREALTPALFAGYGVGFLILFAFIGVFSYVNFVLMRPPLTLGMMSLGLIYFVFAPSIVATPLAGAAARKIGARNALLGGLAVAGAGLWMLAAASLPVVIAGMVLVGLGTFFAQATATGQVSRTAGAARSAASGLYLAAYFAGGLAGAAVIGMVFERAGWTACLWIVAAALAGCALLGAGFGTRIRTAP
jgi:MFS transporter, YNFM family, putative membrane transport protein